MTRYHSTQPPTHVISPFQQAATINYTLGVGIYIYNLSEIHLTMLMMIRHPILPPLIP